MVQGLFITDKVLTNSELLLHTCSLKQKTFHFWIGTSRVCKLLLMSFKTHLPPVAVVISSALNCEQHRRHKTPFLWSLWTLWFIYSQKESRWKKKAQQLWLKLAPSSALDSSQIEAPNNPTIAVCQITSWGAVMFGAAGPRARFSSPTHTLSRSVSLWKIPARCFRFYQNQEEIGRMNPSISFGV